MPFSEIILSPGMYTEFRWLPLTPAMESFHRNLVGLDANELSEIGN